MLITDSSLTVGGPVIPTPTISIRNEELPTVSESDPDQTMTKKVNGSRETWSDSSSSYPSLMCQSEKIPFTTLGGGS